MKGGIFKALTIITTIATAATAQVWDGTSDIIWYNSNPSNNTFYISNGQELAGIQQLLTSKLTTFAGKTIILSSNIDLDNNDWTPIGNATDKFLGIFDGNGKTISGLSVSSSSNRQYAGLFGYVGTDGQIKNLIVNVTGIKANSMTNNSGAFAGGLVGYYASTKTIENCGVKITNNISASTKTSTYSTYSGGLAGWTDATLTINNCYTTGTVSSSTYSGGLAGWANATLTINSCYTAGNIAGSGTNNTASGGLVGYSRTLTINTSYTTGNISASGASISYSGGLLGSTNGTFAVSNSYTTGNISASSASISYSGGLIGASNYTLSNITNCYASGTITAKGDGSLYAGGISGRWDSGTNTSVYYNSAGASKASGSGSPTGILGLTSEQLKKRAAFTGWDFSGIWNMVEDYSMPILINFPVPDVWIPYNDFEITHIFNQPYFGEQIKPAVKVRLKSDKTVLTQNTDYTLSFGENRYVSTGGSVTVTGAGTYAMAGSDVMNFKILRKGLTISNAIAQNKIYDGTTAATITGAVLNGIIGDDEVLIDTIKGTFAGKDVGVNKLVFDSPSLKGADVGNYNFAPREASLTADITKRDLVISLNPKITTIAISDNKPDLSLLLSYDALQGTDTKAVITGTTVVNCSYVKGTSPVGIYPITLTGLVSASNYNLSYDNVGLALIVTGDPKSVDNLTVSPIPDQKYTGDAITPAVTVKDGETTLTAGTHYSLSYSNNIAAGSSALAMIEGIPSGGYTGLKYVSFKIVENIGGTPISDIKKSDKKHGILFENSIISDIAEMTIVLPNKEKVIEAKIAIYDAIGNVVFVSTTLSNRTQSGAEAPWDLTNSAGRFVANGTYLVVAEVKGVSGKTYMYSAKLGIRR
ncbi:MAG: YDG domain-containing protein [Chitinispirillales bacterium]|jgi:hypothetical protein|nr:YDG domain-containing protein [Chitinispirillales bacterium]